MKTAVQLYFVIAFFYFLYYLFFVSSGFSGYEIGYAMGRSAAWILYLIFE